MLSCKKNRWNNRLFMYVGEGLKYLTCVPLLYSLLINVGHTLFLGLKRLFPEIFTVPLDLYAMGFFQRSLEFAQNPWHSSAIKANSIASLAT